MEQDPKQSIFEDMTFDHIAQSYIRTIAKWAVIIGVTLIAINVIQFVKELAAPAAGSAGSSFSMAGMSGMFFAVVALLFGVLVNLFLYLFGSKAKRALDEQDGHALGQSFKHLKSFFMIVSIVIIIAVCFIFFAMLVGGAQLM